MRWCEKLQMWWRIKALRSLLQGLVSNYPRVAPAIPFRIATAHTNTRAFTLALTRVTVWAFGTGVAGLSMATCSTSWRWVTRPLDWKTWLVDISHWSHRRIMTKKRALLSEGFFVFASTLLVFILWAFTHVQWNVLFTPKNQLLYLNTSCVYSFASSRYCYH